MTQWTRYDFLTNREMFREISKRKLRHPDTKNSLTYRQLLTKDDLKNGINPYRSSSSASDENNLVQRQSPLASGLTPPSVSSTC